MVSLLTQLAKLHTHPDLIEYPRVESFKDWNREGLLFVKTFLMAGMEVMVVYSDQ